MIKKKIKKKEHTGFRNNELFCFNCGTAQKIPYPMEMRLAADFFALFARHHKYCAKTWVEPTPTPGGKTEIENARWWWENGEKGISSMTMFNTLSDELKLPPEKGHPHDGDDFNRCYKLLQAVPQFKNKLRRMKSVSPVWSRLIDNWDELTKLFEAGQNNFYTLLQEIIKE